MLQTGTSCIGAPEPAPRYVRHQPELTLFYQIVEKHYPQFLAQLAAVTLIQRFGSALNLNIHFHMLFLDGVYVKDDSGHYLFHRTPPPTVEQLSELLHTLSQRIAGFLERRGLLERDEDNSCLTLEGLDEDPLHDIHTHSVTYRVAMGPQRKLRSQQQASDTCHARQTRKRKKRAGTTTNLG